MTESYTSAPAPAEADRSRNRWLRRLRVAALTASGVALLGGGIVAGWWGREWFGSTERNVTVLRPVTVERRVAAGADVMPNVLGLERESARQALADAGVDLRKVTIKTQPYAADAGVVIDQTPPAAAALPSHASLTLAVPGTVPTLAGLTLDAARSKLSEMGAAVTLRTRYESGSAENIVLATHPAAGQTLSERVTLVVAEPPSSVFLDQLNPVNSSCGTESVNVSGVQHKDSLVCEPSEGSPSIAEYVLNRRVSGFQAIIGLGDRGAADTPVSFRIFVDGRLRFSETLRFGMAKRISVPTAGALRIRLEAGVTRQSASGSQAEAVFGDARFVGGRSAIDRLTAESHS